MALFDYRRGFPLFPFGRKVNLSKPKGLELVMLQLLVCLWSDNNHHKTAIFKKLNRNETERKQIEKEKTNRFGLSIVLSLALQQPTKNF